MYFEKKILSFMIEGASVITITKLNDREVVINSDLIEYIEETPDTTITMTTGRKFIAKESAEVIVDRIISFKHKIYNQYHNYD